MTSRHRCRRLLAVTDAVVGLDGHQPSVLFKRCHGVLPLPPNDACQFTGSAVPTLASYVTPLADVVGQLEQARDRRPVAGCCGDAEAAACERSPELGAGDAFRVPC